VEDRAPGYNPGTDYDVRMDAEDAPAVEAMITAFPSNQLGSFQLYNPLIQAYFEALPGLVRREEGDFYFTVSLERFCPVAGEEVVELTAADASLFEGCERQHRWEYMGEEHRVFGIVRDGRVVTSTGVAPITPARAMKRRVIAISGLYTETRYRRMGLGKRLISYVTELILRDGHAPLYWAEPDNAASQALAQGLGYWRIAQGMRYLWRKV
jgi:GNAT superfamily N-acetyltransferase